MKKIGVSLGGGGAKGFAHIPFLKVFDELDIRPHIISGTSIGAILGAFYASGLSGVEIHEKLMDIGFLDFLKLVDFTGLRQSGLIKGRGVEKFLEKHLPVKRFEDLKIPMKIVATDFWERKEMIFSKGDLIPAIRASISMPGIFSPFELDDRIYIDGGAVNPLPFDIITEDCDIVIAIDVSGERIPNDDTNFPGFINTVLNTFQIMQSSIVSGKISKYIPHIYMKPRLENFKVLEFDKFEYIIESVVDDAAIFKSRLISVLMYTEETIRAAEEI